MAEKIELVKFDNDSYGVRKYTTYLWIFKEDPEYYDFVLPKESGSSIYWWRTTCSYYKHCRTTEEEEARTIYNLLTDKGVSVK